jgi:hypothetical protein
VIGGAQTFAPAIIVVTAAGDQQVAAIDLRLVSQVIRKPFNVSLVAEALSSVGDRGSSSL